MTEFGKALSITTTQIPGLLVVELPVHGDSRGWFKENWQREKMVALGLPDFRPVQNNISFNDEVGTTRGIHAEPWDKFISVATGKIFGAWVDLREGPSFGSVFSIEVDPSRAVFVPRGVANSYQTLEPNTAYTYVVNDHWSPDASYTFLNLADETANIPWPIPLDSVTISDKDQAHPRLSDVTPMPSKKTLVLGANGQLAKALRRQFPHAVFTTRKELDICDEASVRVWNWRDFDTVINAAAYTAVDEAETTEGRRQAWRVNARSVENLARVCTKHDITFVHVSSDYVFDGTKDSAYLESDEMCPLGVYGQSKAAGDFAAAGVPKNYIVRTSWVIGDGNNFVRTMKSLADRGIAPSVVNDQTGRLSFTEDISEGIAHLLASGAPYGIYNLTNSGEPATWYDIARHVYELSGKPGADVTGVSTETYFADKTGIAPRPQNSILNLEKISETGFKPVSWEARLEEYLR